MSTSLTEFQIVDAQAGEVRRDNDELFDIEEIVEHTYEDLSGPTERTVRVELIHEDGNTRLCARNREITVSPPAPSGGPRVCQEFNLVGFACPSGATRFCTTGPILPSSSGQAKQACGTCYGAPCFLETGDCAGPGYGPSPGGSAISGDAYFGYENGCSGSDGRIWAVGSSFTTYGRWAP